jgi:hypothetical protein
MSALQRSAIAARLAKLPPPPSVENEDEEEVVGFEVMIAMMVTQL